MTMDLHLSLTLSNSCAYGASSKTHCPNKKPSLPQLLEHAAETSSSPNGSDVKFPTLSLLPLTPGHSDDHGHEHCIQSSTSTITKRSDDDEEILEVSRNYVKVKMEGVGIARKVNLSTHNSFHTLNQTLMNMFGKCDNQQYELVYQDEEGDWILAQDVSWGSFIECAQRLKLLKRRG